MRVLAVDTTRPRGSLAVTDEQGPLAEARVVCQSGHSRWLLGALEALLCGLGLEARDLDLFAVTHGPGSFTGLRVGLASVQGLALASGRPCLGVSTLDVLARGARGCGDTIVTLVEASRGDVFWAVYDAEARPLGEPAVGPLAAMLAGLKAGSAFVGDAAESGRELIRAGVAGARFPETSGFLATALAGIAIERADEAGPPSALRPLYLRGAAIRPARA